MKKPGIYSCSCLHLQEQQALHYELHKNIALQRRVTLSQAEKIQLFKQENADLKKQLSNAQGWFPASQAKIHDPNSELILIYLEQVHPLPLPPPPPSSRLCAPPKNI
jgi:hypothetical protein